MAMLELKTLPCVMHGVPNADYHAGPGLSHSGAKRLRKSAYHYHALLNPTAPARAPTPQMLNGTLVHCALLEPDLFFMRYVVAPELHKASNAYKDFAAKCVAGGLLPITQQQRDAAFDQAQALRSLPDIAQLMAGGAAEVSAFWRDPAHDILCKCRPDWVSPVGYGKGCVLLDVKTTSDATPQQFARSVANFEYHAQADWYCSGYELASGQQVHGMVFAVVESEYPYACCAYMLDDEAMRKGRQMNLTARATYALCEEAGAWPGYPDTIQVLSLPAWA